MAIKGLTTAFQKWYNSITFAVVGVVSIYHTTNDRQRNLTSRGDTMKLLKNAGIYILRNRDNGKCYVGKDSNLGRRVKEHLALKSQSCKLIHRAIKAHGADTFDVELIHYPNISPETLNQVEKWKIRQLNAHYSQGGYNITWGGDGVDSETARANALKRIEEGFSHQFLGDKNPSPKRIADGTHHFLNSNFQREINRKRVANGTHNFQDGEKARANNLKRFADGTHHFLDKAFKSRRTYLCRLNCKNKRREFYHWVSIILTAKSVCEERIYRKRQREGYFDMSIPDTSNANQLILF